MISYKKQVEKMRILLQKKQVKTEELLKRLEKIDQENLRRGQEALKGMMITVFCSNCQTVYGGSLPKGSLISSIGCGECGASGCLHLVAKNKTSI